MPDWGELAELLARDAGTAPGTSPTIVAQRYEQRFGRVQLVEAVREALHPDKARPGRAHRAFVQLPFDTIYTTNFDLLLEDAYSEATRPFRSLVGELQMPFHAGQMASSIIKMHGDLRHEEHIVVTQRDYDEFMDRYPVVATHLSAMLITRTPLFIGYSLSDPDFENIRKVVRARLGAFERMAYVIQFDITPEQVEESLGNRLHIISLNGASGGGRDETLAALFDAIRKQVDTKAGVTLRLSRPDLFEEVDTGVVQKAVESSEQSPVIETTSRLCFVMMPFGNRFDDVYRLLIEPVVRDNGLTALRADEMAGPGFIIEQIRSAIQQARICIADLTGSNPNVLFEVGYAMAAGKPLVLLGEEGAQFPFNVAHQRVLLYGADVENAQLALQKAISIVLSTGRLDVAARLFDSHQYRSAIAAASIVLEQRLRQALGRRPPARLDRMSLGQLVRTARHRKLLKGPLGGKVSEVVDLRNRAVHELDEPTRQQAQFVLATIRESLKILPYAD